MIVECVSYGWATQWAPKLFQFQISGSMLLALYLAAGVATGRRLAKEAEKLHPDKATVIFWAVITAFIAILFINRFFNLQALATIAARCAAQAEGWYAGRRPMQFIIVALSVAYSVQFFVFAFLRRKAWDERLVLTGMVALVAFVAARSVSFHWVDAYLAARVYGLSFNGLAEGATLAPVLFRAALGPRALLIPPAPRVTPAPSDRDSRK